MLLMVLSLLLLGMILASPGAHAATTQRFVTMTFYGQPDNDPPGSLAIASPGVKGSPPVIHTHAGGMGTYANPITVAVRRGVLPIGTRVYLRRVSKYGIVEDTCASCSGAQVDVFMGGGPPSSWPALLACEQVTTPDGKIVIEVNPPRTRKVSLVKLFDPRTGACPFRGRA